MSEFLRGWRQKTGVVTLVMACVACSIWLRTQHATDVVKIERRGARDVVHSYDGRIIWFHLTLIPGTFPLKTAFPPLLEWKTYDKSHYPNSQLIGPVPSRSENWSWELCGIYCGRRTFVNGYSAVWAVPYWVIAIPLTLLSAYLILWKPRKRLKQDA